MDIYSDVSALPRAKGGQVESAVVSIGIFDGVHRGHQVVLTRAVNLARQLGVKCLVLTFDPHPRLVHNPDKPFALVASLPDRLERLEKLGVDAVLVQHYTLDFAQMSPQEFVRDYLQFQLGALAVVTGSDVRFGRNNAGDAAQLRTLGREIGLQVEIVSDVTDDANRRWSSTWVRQLLSEGKVGQAAKVLGHWHRLRGVVRRGYQRGRKLGYPTANLDPDQLGVVPLDGVYAGWLLRKYPENSLEFEKLPAAISVGTNDTFSQENRTVEAHVLGRTDLNLYGQEVVIELVEYLRPMQKFGSVDELLEQMDLDVKRCAQILQVPPPPRLDPAAVVAN